MILTPRYDTTGSISRGRFRTWDAASKKPFIARNDAAILPPLPHSPPAETAILGTLLRFPETFGDVNDMLNPVDFYVPANIAIFSAMRAAGSSEVIAVIEQLEQDKQSSNERMQYLSTLPGEAGTGTPGNILFYCETLRSYTARRRRIDLAENLIARANDGDLDAQLATVKQLIEVSDFRSTETQLGSLSTAELFAVQDAEIDWLVWPFAAVGLSSILDALPKLGKTRFLLEGIHASRMERPFLNIATQPTRVVYVSEQSAASLAMQAREVGFTGSEPIEELRWITREYWSRFIFSDFLERLEKQLVEKGTYNTLVFDTWHTIARLEDESDASEVNRLGNLSLNVATRNKLALSLGRHDRKSGGDVGVSGRSSIQLSGLVDVILHLVRIPNQTTQRKLELLGRVPGLPSEQLIDLVDDRYLSLGLPPAVPTVVAERVAVVAEWLKEKPALTGDEIVARFAAMAPKIDIALSTAKRYRADAQLRRGKRVDGR